MIVKQILCDRCGAEIAGNDHPPRLVRQLYKKTTRALDPSSYRNEAKIHFCEACTKHFEEFMKNER
jgi:hypothetical protein